MSDFLGQNWNVFASSLLIEACRRAGSTAFFVSPGYRDAPFIAALQSRQDLTLVSCFDERAAGFQALGWAKASGKAAVLLCTSGTAGANYLPAVIEAHTDQIPLLVITADRPFELVHAGAQQVIDQRGLFGRFVKKSLDFPAPNPSMNVAAWVSYARMLLESTDTGPRGPVHINLPFAAPLDPIDDSNGPSPAVLQEARTIFARIPAVKVDLLPPILSDAEAQSLREAIQKAERGLLILGRMDDPREQEAAAQLRDRLNWPLFADVGSQLKLSSPLEMLDLNTPATRKLLDDYAPDCVIHLGRRTVSRHFDDALKRWQPSDYWVFSKEETVQDPYHLPMRRQAQPDLLPFALSLPQLERRPACQRLLEKTEQLRRRFKLFQRDVFNFAAVAQSLAKFEDDNLFVANSTAVRAFDSWTYDFRKKPLRALANRGVSGIEGLLSTSIGLSLASKEAWTLVIGDIALLHDMNAVLSLMQNRAASVCIVLVNNSGGRIFETLPLQAYSWVKDPLISTPHNFQFAGLASMAGLPYRSCNNREDFEAIYRESRGRSCLIECVQEADADAQYAKTMRAQELWNDD